mmetsp:Transcript_17788/g.44497  ORF Transcript_17788/g.44497 Transcript_17788/m.44497 type:complete len:478 (-) Transcript_17788:1517-2950(-)
MGNLAQLPVIMINAMIVISIGLVLLAVLDDPGKSALRKIVLRPGVLAVLLALRRRRLGSGPAARGAGRRRNLLLRRTRGVLRRRHTARTDDEGTVYRVSPRRRASVPCRHTPADLSAARCLRKKHIRTPAPRSLLPARQRVFQGIEKSVYRRAVHYCFVAYRLTLGDLFLLTVAVRQLLQVAHLLRLPGHHVLRRHDDERVAGHRSRCASPVLRVHARGHPLALLSFPMPFPFTLAFSLLGLGVAGCVTERREGHGLGPVGVAGYQAVHSTVVQRRDHEARAPPHLVGRVRIPRTGSCRSRTRTLPGVVAFPLALPAEHTAPRTGGTYAATNAERISAGCVHIDVHVVRPATGDEVVPTSADFVVIHGAEILTGWRASLLHDRRLVRASIRSPPHLRWRRTGSVLAARSRLRNFSRPPLRSAPALRVCVLKKGGVAVNSIVSNEITQTRRGRNLLLRPPLAGDGRAARCRRVCQVRV